MSRGKSASRGGYQGPPWYRGSAEKGAGKPALVFADGPYSESPTHLAEQPVGKLAEVRLFAYPLCGAPGGYWTRERCKDVGFGVFAHTSRSICKRCLRTKDYLAAAASGRSPLPADRQRWKENTFAEHYGTAKMNTAASSARSEPHQEPDRPCGPDCRALPSQGDPGGDEHQECPT